MNKGKVGVLAVWDAMHKVCISEGIGVTDQEEKEARAALVELIAADVEFNRASNELNGWLMADPLSVTANRMGELDAAYNAACTRRNAAIKAVQSCA